MMTGASYKKNKKMVELIVKKGYSQAKAHAESRGRDYILPSDSPNASNLMKREEVQQMMQTMRTKFMFDAPEAYKRLWTIADDPATPPHVKAKVLSDFLDRAGLSGPDLMLHKHEHTVKYPDLDLTKEEIIELLQEPESAAVISARNSK